MSATTRPIRRRQPRLQLDVTRSEIIRLAEGFQRKRRPIRLAVSKHELIILQDAVDDYAGDAGAGGTGAKRLTALQRRLHTLTGEQMPPTPRARRAALRRIPKHRGAK